MAKNDAIGDRISSELAGRVGKEFTDLLSRDETRNKIKEVLNECIDSVPFMRKVKEYAAEEIDTKIYKSINFWVKTILIPVVVSIMTALILNYFKLI